MESHIRTSDRRGCLSTRRLSAVQALALDMMMLLEQVDKARKHQEEIKLSIMERDPEEVQKWFPEWFAPKPIEVRTAEDVDDLVAHELSGGGSVWEAGESPPITAEEMEAMIRALSQGSGTLRDLEAWE